MQKTYTEAQIVEILKSRISFEFSQSDLAAELGENRPTLCEVLNGKRRLTKQIAAALGYVRIDNIYRKKAKVRA